MNKEELLMECIDLSMKINHTMKTKVFVSISPHVGLYEFGFHIGGYKEGKRRTFAVSLYEDLGYSSYEHHRKMGIPFNIEELHDYLKILLDCGK